MWSSFLKIVLNEIIYVTLNFITFQYKYLPQADFLPIVLGPWILWWHAWVFVMTRLGLFCQWHQNAASPDGSLGSGKEP